MFPNRAESHVERSLIADLAPTRTLRADDLDDVVVLATTAREKGLVAPKQARAASKLVAVVGGVALALRRSDAGAMTTPLRRGKPRSQRGKHASGKRVLEQRRARLGNAGQRRRYRRRGSSGEVSGESGCGPPAASGAALENAQRRNQARNEHFVFVSGLEQVLGLATPSGRGPSQVRSTATPSSARRHEPRAIVCA